MHGIICRYLAALNNVSEPIVSKDLPTSDFKNRNILTCLPTPSTASSTTGGGCTSVASASTASGTGNNGGAIQKRFKGFNSTSQSANASPSKNGLSLNIKPSWAPLASLNGSTASLDRTTTQLSGAMSKRGMDKNS